MMWRNPLGNLQGNRQLKLPPPHGRFGAVRKHDMHTGIDLYAPRGSDVYTVEAGVVVAVDYFTGPSVGMPWWEDTRAALIEGESGVVCYGEIQEWNYIKAGTKIDAGIPIGTVLTVLKKDKGLPMSMLHLELHTGYDKTNIWHAWNLNEPKPEYLLDPYEKLKHLFGGKLKANDQRYQDKLNTHDFISFERRDYYDSDYQKCKNCGFVIYQIGPSSNTYSYSTDLSPYKNDDLTCNEILLEQLLK